MKTEIIDRIHHLMENEKIFLNARMNEKEFSKLLGISRKELQETLAAGFNMKFSTLISMNRLIHAREMMLIYGVDYGHLWLFSGFRSHREFYRLCSKVGF